jgi:SAM-dependent methyltransferase
MTRLSFSLDDDRYRRLDETARRTGATPVDVARIAVEEYLSREIRDRAEWLKERRRLAEERMDLLFAPTYDARWGQVDPTHRAVLETFLGLCPRGGFVLDAACGTGKYWPLILEGGFRLAGVDQSKNMLLKANAKFPGVPLEKAALQDLAYTNVYDGIICVDAMEYVPPEEWPTVLGNFHRALRAGGHLYFTVELAEETELREAYIAAKALKLPVVEGEWAYEGGYHYYPGVEQVRKWIADAGFTLVDESTGDGYEHFVMGKA